MTWYTINLAAGWRDGVKGTCIGTPDEEGIDRCGGFFAAVSASNDRVFAAVDRIRSIPIFYAQKDGHLYLSDDANWIRERVGSSIDPTAKEEFLLTGYVTGRDTLFSDIKQLQAGEYLIAKANGVRLKRYFVFVHSEGSPDHLSERFDEAFFASIDRLIAMAGGRQIVIPLSGGLDSRLILAGLIQRGYKNLLTFTYGSTSNPELSISRSIVQQLGVDWHFFEYTPASWKAAYHSNEGAAYRRMAGNLTSLPHMQDFLATQGLRKKFEPGCIVVPGHTGDFICGGHLPSQARPGMYVSAADLPRSVASRHYTLNQCKPPLLAACLHERIYHCAGSAPVTSPVMLADAYEKWEWQERQAKYIANSVRVYEFFDLSWWLPLWGDPFVRFWQSVPLGTRSDKDWYPLQVDRLSRLAGISTGRKTERSSLKHRTMVSAIKAGHRASSIAPALAPAIQSVKNLFSAARDMQNPLMLGHTPYKRASTFMKLAGGQRILGLHAQHYLKETLDRR